MLLLPLLFDDALFWLFSESLLKPNQSSFWMETSVFFKMRSSSPVVDGLAAALIFCWSIFRTSSLTSVKVTALRSLLRSSSSSPLPSSSLVIAKVVAAAALLLNICNVFPQSSTGYNAKYNPMTMLASQLMDPVLELFCTTWLLSWRSKENNRMSSLLLLSESWMRLLVLMSPLSLPRGVVSCFNW